MQYQHDMPFGATILSNGSVRFQLWAPAAKTVDLCLNNNTNEILLKMDQIDDGWFFLVTQQATAGTRYYYQIDRKIKVPDPASRFQPDGVHGRSEVVNANDYTWRNLNWRGLPWEQSIIYELHVGAFSNDGDFKSVEQKLDYLKQLGITAIELMPVAEFAGRYNWGYDGVSLFAPDSSYGNPNSLKSLIDAAHDRGIMVFLDVVYNHFGPEGNYLHCYAPAFFNRHHTPWGKALNFDGNASYWVRQFFIHNALYWLEEYCFDGLRLDAVHSIVDDSNPHILQDIAQTVRQSLPHRQTHLILENDHNESHYLNRQDGKVTHYTAQWNDDLHHALHVLLTRETQSYYMDYRDNPQKYLKRCLREGFAYQGEISRFRENAPRGENSRHLPPLAFVSFLQNHDQIGNRPRGERIHQLCPSQSIVAVTAIILLAPFPPLLFMGQEWGATQPFLFFCDFEPHIAKNVRKGRRREYKNHFQTQPIPRNLPDPTALSSFSRSKLDWIHDTGERRWLDLHQQLLAIRKKEVIPRIGNTKAGVSSFNSSNSSVIDIQWPLDGDKILHLVANLSEQAIDKQFDSGNRVIYDTHHHRPEKTLPPWSVIWQIGG